MSSPTSISTEMLLTSPHGYGVKTATPVQRAACRVRDGKPLLDLRDNAEVVGTDPSAISPLHKAVLTLNHKRKLRLGSA